jgi:hypothetical protein
MYTLNLISIAIATLFTTAQAVPTPDPLIPGYTITDFVWEVESYPGGPKANVTGTAQDVATHLSAVNPNWKTDFNISEALQVHQESKQKKRDLSFPFTSILCWVREDEWGFAFRLPLLDDIDFLNVVPGIPTMGPGPGACGRVACSDTAAVYWCNDETETFSLPSFATVASGASAILDNCLDERLDIVNGQVFAQFLQNWNTIVRSDTC